MNLQEQRRSLKLTQKIQDKNDLQQSINDQYLAEQAKLLQKKQIQMQIFDENRQSMAHKR